MGQKKGGHDHGNDSAKKDDGKVLTMEFKIDVHCEGCGSRIVKVARGMTGVESAKVDCDKNRLSVVGEVDPVKLRDKLESKLKKKIELISPLPIQKDEQKQENKKPEGDKKADENKSKEKKSQTAKVASLKIHLHCDGCIEKIHHILSKTDDVESVTFDKQKDLVTMKGTMDVMSICEMLEKKMKRRVEIVPPKKSDGKDDSKAKESADKKVEASGDGGKPAEFNRMMMPMPMAAHPGYGYGYGYNAGPGYPNFGPGYSSYPVQSAHAPQMFSDENPNACSVM